MVLRLGSNIQSLQTQGRLSSITTQLSRSLERLSSGSRINRASDDAAGLSISTTLGAQSRVLTQANRNVNDAISLLNIAEGTAREFTSVLQRLRELATGAANGSVSRAQRLSLDSEATQLQREFNRMAASSRFNSLAVSDGSLANFVVQLGLGSSDWLALSVGGELGRNIGTGSFTQSTVNPSLNGITEDFVTGDFNGDGRADIWSYNRVFLSNGDGTFQDGQTVGGGFGILSRAGDIDGDGKVDLISSTGTGANIYFGNGDGTFVTTPMSVSGAANFSEVADFNGDGMLDLVGRSGSSIQLVLNQGGRQFSSTISSSVGAAISSLDVGDFNGDGRTDIVARQAAGATHIMLGSGSGTFSSAGSLTTSGSGYDLVSIDINHDGISDLAYGTGSGVAYRLGSASGVFSSATTISGIEGYRLRVADMNNDGEDVLVGTNFSSVRVFLSDGNGILTSSSTMLPSVPVATIGIGDFNGDGVNDIAVADDSGGGGQALLQGASETTSFQRLNLTTRQGALAALSTIDAALARVTFELGQLGSSQSRLDVARTVLDATTINFAAARSRIVDADIAAETAAATRSQILSQAASSVLAQANQQPELALALLSN